MLVTRETLSGPPPHDRPGDGAVCQLPYWFSQRPAGIGSRAPPDSARRRGRGAAAGTWTMKYSQKLQPGSVLFSLRVLMSSSNLPRFLVKDISSNVLSLVKKAFQDS